MPAWRSSRRPSIALEPADLGAAEDGARSRGHVERDGGLTAVAIDHDTTLHDGEGVSERLQRSSISAFCARSAMVEGLAPCQRELAANGAGVLAHRVEASQRDGGELGRRPFVEVHLHVTVLPRLARDHVGGEDAGVEEAARAIVELDAAKIELKRERVEVSSAAQASA